MVKKTQKRINNLENLSLKITNSIGTPYSIVAHTAFFIGIFLLKILGISTERILLILTTVVSLEAIYLAIFIQMTVNRNTASLESVEDDIEDIQEDVKGLEDEIEDISSDVEGISEDIDKIQSEEDEPLDAQSHQILQNIKDQLRLLQEDLQTLKKNNSLPR